MRRVSRSELARAIEVWGVFRWCITRQRRIQLQIWTPDEQLARRLCAQYGRKFYACRVTRPYLRPHTMVYPVTFSQRGTAAILLWVREKFACERHRKIATAVWTASERAKRVRSVSGRIRAGEPTYLHKPRRRAEFLEAFMDARDLLLRFWEHCPLSLYGEYARARDAERAGVVVPTLTVPGTTRVELPPKVPYHPSPGTRAGGRRTPSTSAA